MEAHTTRRRGRSRRPSSRAPRDPRHRPAGWRAGARRCRTPWAARAALTAAGEGGVGACAGAPLSGVWAAGGAACCPCWPGWPAPSVSSPRVAIRPAPAAPHARSLRDGLTPSFLRIGQHNRSVLSTINQSGQPATALYSPSTSPPLELEEGRWRGSRAAAAAGGAHCGFRRCIQETPVLTLQIKFAYSLNSLKCQLSQSKLFGQALRIIAAGLCSFAGWGSRFHLGKV